MARRGGWRRVGSRRRFQYLDGHGNPITDPVKLARIQSLVIPPAWKDVWISPRAAAKLQATGVDAAGRRQYLYHPDFRAQQEQAKFDKLIRFAEHLPDLRQRMSEHMSHDELDRERISALAVRLINHGWFRVGSERYAQTSKTFGITTLTKRHIEVRGSRIKLGFRAKHGVMVRTAIVDPELAAAIRRLLAVKGGRRLFRYEWEGELYSLTGKRLNDYVREHLGDEFTAKDFRTWGGTLAAAVAFAELGVPETEAEAKRAVAAVMRRVGEKLGNTPAVARASYVSPAVVEQYLDRRTIEDFRPRHLRVVRARETGLNDEEQALLTLLRSWRIRRSQMAA
ncbi:MAG: DNA topoisomerase IB [Actinobacteria bacterium]|nr:DNA topoisomerase IB [Actinomycetota bacterium]